MGDSETGEELWSERNGEVLQKYSESGDEALEAQLPKQLLQSQAVWRQVVFSSTQPIKHFHIQQRVYLQEH